MASRTQILIFRPVKTSELKKEVEETKKRFTESKNDLSKTIHDKIEPFRVAYQNRGLIAGVSAAALALFSNIRSQKYISDDGETPKRRGLNTLIFGLGKFSLMVLARKFVASSDQKKPSLFKKLLRTVLA